jgi:hypothetical protein
MTRRDQITESVPEPEFWTIADKAGISKTVGALI